jgi:molybdopterin biosynthesis enzyme
VKVHLVTREQRPAQLAGLILCHELRGAAGDTVFTKGHVLSDTDIMSLVELPWTELHLIQPEPDEVHEDPAGERMARSSAGDGVEVKPMSGGHWPMAATHRGILAVETELLDRTNEIEGVCVYTIYDGQVVEAGEVVARAKITPFVIKESHLAEAEVIASEAGGLVRVRAFKPMKVGAVVQETLGERAMERFREALGEKVGWFGSEMVDPRFVKPKEDAIAGALEELVKGKADVIALAGTKAMDPLDPAFRALTRLGVPLERYGVPAHPGSLFWLAHLDEVPILGMPSCGLFAQATVFDLVLPRVLTGEWISRDDLVKLGHGGLLTREMSFRFPRYRSTKERGAVE